MGRTDTRATGRASHRRFKVDVGGGASVSVEIRRPRGYDPQTTPGLVLAHGAGADMTHLFMSYFFEELGRDLLTVRFNFLYKEQGRGAPDAARKLESTYRAVLEHVRALGDAPRRLYIGGKSMGGRMATHLAAAGDPAAGAILFGYPLHPPGRRDRLRDAHLPDIRCPLLFIQGTRDTLCDLDLLRQVLRGVRAPHDLHVIEDGDHSFKVLKRTGRSYDDVLAEVRGVVHDWIREKTA